MKYKKLDFVYYMPPKSDSDKKLYIAGYVYSCNMKEKTYIIVNESCVNLEYESIAFGYTRHEKRLYHKKALLTELKNDVIDIIANCDLPFEGQINNWD